jgi:hypothetical protein
MAITTEPYYEILPAYRPVKFLAEVNIDPTVYQPENAVVAIYKNAVLLATVRYKVAYLIAATPPTNDYFFEIDIQKYCQDSLAPDTTAAMPMVFAGSGTGTVQCTDAYAEYNIEITYEGVDLATGLLVDMGVSSDTSSVFTVFSITRQHNELMDLFYYYGTIGLTNGHCLTKSSRELSVCTDDNTFLTYIFPNSQETGLEVKLYDAAGVLLSEGFTDITYPATTNDHALFSANVGVNSLKSTSFVSGTPDFLDPDLAYYTVSFGTPFLFPLPTGWLYTRHTEVFTFTIGGECCGRRALRLHWLNLLGGVDSYTFNSEKDYQIKTNSETGRKSLTWIIGGATPHSPNDFGGFKYNSKASTAFILRSKYLTNTEATFLQDLLVSPKVYVDLEGQFYPVLIQDQDQSIDRQNGRIRYEITAKMANDYIIQRV